MKIETSAVWLKWLMVSHKSCISRQDMSVVANYKIRNCAWVPWFHPWFYFLFLLSPAAVEPGMMALCAFAGKAREVAADAFAF